MTKTPTSRTIKRLSGPKTPVCWTPDYTLKAKQNLVTFVLESDLTKLELELALANKRKEYYRAAFGKVCDKHADDEILESCVFCDIAAINEHLEDRLREILRLNTDVETANEKLARLRKLAKAVLDAKLNQVLRTHKALRAELEKEHD